MYPQTLYSFTNFSVPLLYYTMVIIKLDIITRLLKKIDQMLKLDIQR